MKSKARRFKDESEWNPWFAWFPVKAAIGQWPRHSDTEPRFWRWVWLETIERKIHGSVSMEFSMLYRIPEAER